MVAKIGDHKTARHSRYKLCENRVIDSLIEALQGFRPVGTNLLGGGVQESAPVDRNSTVHFIHTWPKFWVADFEPSGWSEFEPLLARTCHCFLLNL